MVRGAREFRWYDKRFWEKKKTETQWKEKEAQYQAQYQERMKAERVQKYENHTTILQTVSSRYKSPISLTYETPFRETRQERVSALFPFASSSPCGSLGLCFGNLNPPPTYPPSYMT